jgi:hypothetical protein
MKHFGKIIRMIKNLSLQWENKHLPIKENNMFVFYALFVYHIEISQTMVSLAMFLIPLESP